MSSSKRKSRSKNGKPASPSYARSGSKSGSNAETTKKQLSPLATALIVLPTILVLGVSAWYFLSQGGGNLSTSNHSNVAPDNNNKLANLQSGNPTELATEGDFGTGDSAVDTWTTATDQIQTWNKIDNAAEDGWGTEVTSDRITDQFLKLKKTIVSKVPIDAEAVAFLATDELAVQTLLPTNVNLAFSDDRIQVKRGVFDTLDLNRPDGKNSGTTGAQSLADALRPILAEYKNRETLHMKLKVFRIEESEDSITTHQTLELYGSTAEGTREENSIWLAEWTNEKKPRLKDIHVVQYESVELTGGPMFSDVTESMLNSVDSFRQQLLIGYDRWLDRSQADNAFVLLGNNGIAIGDVNSDGLEDIYVCQESGLPNLLYLQNPDGSLRDASRESGVNWLQNSSAALIIDLNNDGHEDLAVGLVGGVVIAEGDGTGKFIRRKILDSNDNIWSLTAADYDRDGKLDLHVGTYSADGATAVAANVVIASSDGEYAHGGVNSLYKNESNGEEFSFRDVTEECGLLQNNSRYTFAAAWEDFDNDGDQDLYVANDFGWNNFYRNDSQEDGTVKFVDIAEQANAQDDAFGMSVNWADYNRDGWMDVYISNMFSYAGNRITFQDHFKSDSSDNLKKRYQRYARGNTLLKNSGKPANSSDVQLFEDQSLETAVNMGRWAWSSCFIDFNNDGWEDLFTTNGYITSDDNGDL